MNFLERYHVVNLQILWIGDDHPGIDSEPQTINNLPLAIGLCLDCDGNQTFFNQDFLAGIFMVPIGINPVLVEVPVIGLEWSVWS